MKDPRNRVPAVAVALIVVSAAFLLVEVSPQARASTVPLTGKYIMAFLACDTSTSNCSDPQKHVTYLAESNDSISWSLVPGFAPYSGSVPDAIRRGNTIYMYNPGTIARFHLDTGIEDRPTAATLKFSNGTSAIFVDPSVFLDSNGTIHLFYLPGIFGQDPAQCPVGESSCTKSIMSATEVAGSDGGSFIVDAGTRASYTITQCCFSDPAVFQGPDGYYMYASEGQAVIAFYSPTLTGSYTTVQGLGGGILVQQGTGGVPAGYYDNSTRSFWTFISRGSSAQGIARASTTSIGSSIPSSSFSTILSGCDVPPLGCSFIVASPGFHLNTPGKVSTSTNTTTTRSSQTEAVNFATIPGARLGLSPPDAKNIIGPSVLKLPGGTYRMYFQARDSGGYANIMSASSSDGIHWAYDAGVRVEHGSSSSSIDSEAGEPDVVRGSNGTYFMTYTGRQQIQGAPAGSFYHKIVFASSADSLNWTKDGYNFSDPAQMGGFSSSADVISVNGKYEMYYTGCCQNISGIFRAESADFVHWTPVGQTFEVGHDGSTVLVNGTYYMFFMAPPSFAPTTPMDQDVLFLAVSGDGIHWSNHVYPVALTNASTSATVDTSTLGDPAAMVAPDGALIVYVNGPQGQSIVGIKPTSSLPPAPASTTSTTSTVSSSSSTTTHVQSSTTSTTVQASSSSPTSTLPGTTASSSAISNTTATSLTAATTSGGGGIPEFPYQLGSVALFTFILLVSILLARTRESWRGDKAKNLCGVGRI